MTLTSGVSRPPVGFLALTLVLSCPGAHSSVLLPDSTGALLFSTWRSHLQGHVGAFQPEIKKNPTQTIRNRIFSLQKKSPDIKSKLAKHFSHSATVIDTEIWWEACVISLQNYLWNCCLMVFTAALQNVGGCTEDASLALMSIRKLNNSC